MSNFINKITRKIKATGEEFELQIRDARIAGNAEGYLRQKDEDNIEVKSAEEVKIELNLDQVSNDVVSKIQTDIESLDSRTTDVENDIVETKSRLTIDEENIALIDSRVTTAEGDITTLKGEVTSTIDRVSRVETNLSDHVGKTDNPHQVTKAQVGLSEVDNTSDLNKPMSTATQTALDDKVDKETGKGLSTNDFTDDLKTKLDGIEPNAQKNVQSDWNQESTIADDYINNKPTIPSLEGYATEVYVDEKIKTVAGLNFKVVDELPETGEKGIIYLIKSEEIEDSYEQWVWMNTGSEIEPEWKWSKIGTTSVDLSDYLKKADAQTIYAKKEELDNYTTHEEHTNLINDVQSLNGTISDHINDKENPHSVTKAQVGLSNVENIAPEEMPISNAQKIVNEDLIQRIDDHINDKENPHEVTYNQTGSDIKAIYGVDYLHKAEDGLYFVGKDDCVVGQRYILTRPPYTEYVCYEVVGDGKALNSCHWTSQRADAFVDGENHILYSSSMSADAENHCMVLLNFQYSELV